MPNQEDHFGELTRALDRLRAALVELRQLRSTQSHESPCSALESANNELHSVEVLIRQLQSETDALEARLDRTMNEVWHLKAKRAETTARLASREQLLERIQQSVVWKAVKPLWKIVNRSKKAPSKATENDLEFGFDLPLEWKTNHEILFVRGWCFSRSGRQIVGVRAKLGKKGRLGRYGLRRPEFSFSHRHFSLARNSGFTIEIRVPPGISRVRFEAIEQGSDWQPFCEQKVEREKSQDSEGESPDVVSREVERKGPTLISGSISPEKAFALLKPKFEAHSQLTTQHQTPYFSVITPTHNTRPQWLVEAAISLLEQSFSNWEWCIVDDGSEDRQTKALIERLSSISPRVRVQFAAKAGISAANNRALDLARGDYVCFLDHDDLLHWFALEAIADKLQEGLDIVYTDEDKLDDALGELVEPFHKPAWSPEYFRGVMYVGHLLCVRRELVARTRFDSAFDGVQDFDFVLRLSETTNKIGHVPQVLYHWRKTPGSIAQGTEAKPQISLLQKAAVNAHLRRVKLPASAEPLSLPHRLAITPDVRASRPRVSIIIPTKDAPDMLHRCLESIFAETSYSNFEVILVDNETTDEAAHRIIKQYPVKPISFRNPFNFSRANNQGAATATGEFLVFLNNDTEIVSSHWLDHLLYYAEQNDVGAVGALLIYADRTVQHAGVTLGMRGTADHAMRGFPLGVDGYAGSLVCAREVSAVTAACMMIRKSLFQEMGGFNEHFFTAYQDVDLCLRLRERGLRVICTPQALAIHHESVSRKDYYDMIDRTLLLDRWERTIERGDPYYNPNLNLERGDYSRRSA